MSKIKKFLLITPSYAYNPADGGGQRTQLIFKALAELGTVDVLLIGDGDLPFLKQFFSDANSVFLESPPERSELGFWRLVRPLYPKLINKIAMALGSRCAVYKPTKKLKADIQSIAESNKYDLIVGRYLRPTSRSGILSATTSPIILDVDDRDDLVYKSISNRQELRVWQRLIYSWHYKQVVPIMSDLLPNYSHIWLTNRTDFNELSHSSKSILPNIPFIPDSKSSKAPTPENRASKIILFVGSYGHRVNKEGIERFITKCWPKIYQHDNQAKFRIVGSGGWENLADNYKNTPNIEVVGFAEDLSKEYENSAFTVVPLFEGGGTKIKVLESLIYNRATVVTKFVKAGYEELKHQNCLMVANNENELINQCINLIDHPELREKLAFNGRTTVRQKYSNQKFFSIIKETTENLFKLSQ